MTPPIGVRPRGNGADLASVGELMTEPPALSATIDSLVAFLTRYVAFPSEHEPLAIALWVVHAHTVEQSEVSPILAVTSAEMRSGKTRVLDCLELLVPHPFRVVTPSEAVVYTVLAQRPRRTMLLDEADAIFGTRHTAERYEGLRAILNAGNRQGTPVLRVKLEGRRREVDEFDVYGAKAIAGIGKLPDTVTDRAIPIRMKRRAPAELVAHFRRRTAKAEGDEIVRQIRDLSVSVPDVPDVPVPETLNDRAADSWEPLLVIADLAGGDWPRRSRLAAIALSGESDHDLSVGIRLLSEIKDLFESKATDHISTHDLLVSLVALELGPWDSYYGKPLTARGLAKLLEPYDVMPKQRRIVGGKMRGFFAQDFTDAWARYVPVGGTGTTGTSGTPGLWDESEAELLDQVAP